MDTKGVVLVDVSKGALGKSASSVLGSLIVTKLALASLSRQDTSEDLRIPHLLYVDEAHNFGYGVDYGTILSESRKYRLGACDRNPDPLAASGKHGRGNFRQRRLNWKLPRIPRRRPGPRQAFCSGGEGMLSPDDLVMPASVLQNLPDHKMVLQALVDGRPHDPVRVDAFPPLPRDEMKRIWKRKGITADRNLVIRRSLERYGRPRHQVEAQLNQFLTAA